MANPKTSRSSPSKEQDVPTIKVSGDFSDTLSVLNGTGMSLLVGLGEVGTSDVLVPLVNFHIFGQSHDQKEGERFLSTTLTLENTAYVAADMTEELRSVFDQLRKFSKGGLSIERSRADAIRQYLEHSATSIAGCIEALGQMTGKK